MAIHDIRLGELEKYIHGLKRKQLAQNTVIVLAVFFIAGSIASAKVKTLRHIKAGSITSSYIHNRAVTNDKLASAAVTGAKLKKDSVSTEKIVDSAVTSDKIADNSVNANKIPDNAVGSNEIAAGAVSSDKIADGTVTAGDILDGTITAAKLASGVITGNESSAWGSITGTLSSQSDLQSALDEKAGKYEIAVGDSGYGSTLAEAVTAIGSDSATLVVPSGTQEGGGVTIPGNVTLKVMKGALIHVADGVSFTINGDLEAGLYQVFSWTGSGSVALANGSIKETYPQWFGAAGDGSNDDTAALDAAEAATATGGVIHLSPGTYKTTGWLITKTLSLVSDAPFAYGSSSAANIKAAEAQAYVLKFQGVYGAGNGSTFVHPFVRNINIDGDSQAISDAAFILENSHLAHVEGCGFLNTNGHGVRLRTVWELRLSDFFISNCGTVDNGSAFFIDGPTPFNAIYGSNDISIMNGIWSANRGRWLDADYTANLDAAWIKGNKFELDSATTPNTENTDVIHLGAASRTMIVDNTFAGFGVTSDKYANLVYINGDPGSTSYGGPGNVVRGNRAYGYASNGAVNGLYLDTDAPPTLEADNTFSTNDGQICPNVNVSKHPQLINRAWSNFSTSLYPVNPLPDRELPGFLSIHKVQRGTPADPPDFVPDANSANNSQTVLKLTAFDEDNANICAQLDLSRYVGNDPLENLIVKIRMKRDSGGDDTVSVNPSSPGAWNPVNVAVDDTNWKWYSFTIPISTISTANHMMDVYFWAGTAPLYVDGFEFSVN